MSFIKKSKYIYQYKDHLGNIRLSYSDTNGNGTIKASSEILEENNYYPFGMKHEGYNNVVLAENPYKYNGKELNEELGLDWYDYGARNYDASLGRWMNLDNLAEDYYPISPYVYAINNPMFFIDPDGNKIVIYYGKNQDQEEEYKYKKDRDYSEIGDSFLADSYKALDALYEASNIEVDGETVNVLDKLIGDPRELSVVKGSGKSHFAYARKFESKGKWKDLQQKTIGTIHFNNETGVLFDDVNNPESPDEFYDKNGNLKKSSKINSPTSLLGHESIHAFNYATNRTSYLNRRKDKTTRTQGPYYFKSAEEARATTLSSQINIKLKENPRKNHKGMPVKTQGVLTNKIKS